MRARLAQERMINFDGGVPRRAIAERAPHSSRRAAWTYQQLTPERVIYDLCLAITFEGPVDDTALPEVFELVGRRHKVLRAACHADHLVERYQRAHSELPTRRHRIGLCEQPEAENRRRN
ncbi:hypothetical protein [Frankia nepalensis]|uniref:Condensation domain-containing protein n=2 Tax=Frankia nepalensis TaxID=1836974 RepID=A0A937RT53_9ACTN|nr:hypothetical protein [Frankia nepalensis]MBL7494880.1 hypothetical protein [Frankia nepalensis]MBL7632874.1 hypothetical protein [Frankia nepalensis]